MNKLMPKIPLHPVEIMVLGRVFNSEVVFIIRRDKPLRYDVSPLRGLFDSRFPFSNFLQILNIKHKNLLFIIRNRFDISTL
jgi:hypothetical protein